MLQTIDCFLNAVVRTQLIRRRRMVIVTDCFAELFAVSGVDTRRLDAGIQALSIIKGFRAFAYAIFNSVSAQLYSIRNFRHIIVC